MSWVVIGALILVARLLFPGVNLRTSTPVVLALIIAVVVIEDVVIRYRARRKHDDTFR